MNKFLDFSIRKKLVVLTVLISGASLLLFTVATITRSLLMEPRKVAEHVGILAAVIAENTASPLMRNDPLAAAKTLAALRAEPSITYAYVYDSNNRPFAGYARGETKLDRMVDSRHHTKHQAMIASRETGERVEDGDVEAFRPILHQGKRLGTVFVEADQGRLHTLLAWDIATIAAISLLALLLAVILASRLQRVISQPLIQLARTAARVSQEGVYGLRAQKTGHDEIGALVDSFNDMLAQIELRDEKLAELLEARTSERTFLQNIIDAVPDPIMVIGSDYRVLLMNKVASLRAGSPSQPGGGPILCHQISHHSAISCGDHLCPMDEVRLHLQPLVVEHEHYNGDGQLRVMEVSAAPLLDKHGSFIGIVESARDITERRQAEKSLLKNQQHLDHMAHHDPLTGLPNRLLFQDRFQQAILKAGREHKMAALLLLDLDRFKNVNDSFGHHVGDQLLQAVALRLKSCVREMDTVARLGGDEFAVTLEGIEGTDTASHVARKIIEALASPFEIERHELFINTSIGISLYPADSEDADTLAKNADSAMYLAKEAGRGNFQFFTPAIDATANRRLTLENHLRRALERNELKVYYQPQVDLKRQKIVSAEALLRWENPEMGFPSPAEFIPIAEESDLIVSIGEWVMESACAQIKAWDNAGLPPLRVAVNLSARQFRQLDLLTSAQRILSAHQLSPNRLDLELTEIVLFKNIEASINLMKQIKDTGILLSIDDFCIGYSSLSHLDRFSLSHMKVAQAFVHDIPINKSSTVIAQTAIFLAKNMGLSVIVEGVETAEQLRFFQNLECDLVQGNYFSPPLPADEFVKLLGAPLILAERSRKISQEPVGR
ncbi:MAG: bifunctional diguanylate cyclase/phosphodiesterase [Sulfuricella sp.]